MNLNRLILTNFKGVRDLTLAPGPKITKVYGGNAAGKTTLFDAWLFLLFGKDSQGRADFDIKTLDIDGKVIADVEHAVEAVVEIDGREITLRRVFLEKWRGKRSGKPELAGHETKYFVDGVPCRELDYKARIAHVIREDRFKLLTDPRCFSEGLKWQDRRTLVLEMCGNVSDADVTAADSRLSVLGEFLTKKGMSLEDYREVLKASRTKLAREIEECKPRIDEVHTGLPVLDNAGICRKDIEGQLQVLRTRRQGDLEELNLLRAGGGIQAKQNEIRQIEADMQAERTMARQALLKEIADLEAERQAKVLARNGLADDRRRNERRLSERETEKAALEERREDLLKGWHEANKPAEAEVTFKPDSTCPTCGQSLPAEQIQAAMDKALATLRQRKSQRLKDIDTEGQENKAKRLKLTEDMTALRTNVDTLTERMATLDGEAAGLAETIAGLKRLADGIDQCEPTAKYSALAAQKRTLQTEIDELRAGSYQAQEATLTEGISNLDASIAAAEKTLAQLDQRDKGLKRIEELKARQKKLGGEYETVEKSLALTDLFVTTKVRLLESHINDRFTFARFKMFRELVGGGVEECCEVVYQGVPYLSLNGAARLNVGLDIINTLAAHWKTVAPVWIDQAGEVTDILETTGQQIRLYISEHDPVLRVEA